MHFVYVDDSKDERIACFSALVIPADAWLAALDHMVGLRRRLRAEYGVYTREEIHATKWLAGKGEVADHPIRVPERVKIYNFILDQICEIPGVRLINAASRHSDDKQLFERLLNRINTNMERSGSHAVVFSDEGKNYDALLRKLRRHNPVASRFGRWPDGNQWKNIPLTRILEDLVYRDSKHSLFVQAADCCAYALLRHESRIASKTALGLHESLARLQPIMVTAANQSDRPYGIIR